MICSGGLFLFSKGFCLRMSSCDLSKSENCLNTKKGEKSVMSSLVIGFIRRSGTAKRTGNAYDLLELHALTPVSQGDFQNGFRGKAVKSYTIFNPMMLGVDPSKFPPLPFYVDIFYNERGFVECVQVGEHSDDVMI